MVKVFEYFLEFPEEVRKVVINEMSPEDRCRFTRCSKLSQIEARKCKNYIYGMKFEVISPIAMKFQAVYNKKNRNSGFGDYSVYFVSGAHKYISYTNNCGLALWTTQLDRSTNLVQFACDNVKNMLDIYQNTIKQLGLRGTRNYDFEIRSLKNLESLTLCDITDIRQIISKIQKPLKEFECYWPIPRDILADFEQMYKVQNLLKVGRIDINYEQFQKLSARKLYMDIGHLTELDISSFINSWQNDKLRKNFEYCRWFIERSNFDLQKLFRLLRIEQNVDEMQFWTKIDISHNMDSGKKAELGFNQHEFDFRVINQ